MRFLVIAVASVVLFFPSYWLFSSVAGDTWGAVIAAVGMYLGFPVLAMKVWPPRRGKSRDSMEVALASGCLITQEYEIHGAIELGQSEDEGLHFLLDLGDGTTLFVSGQYLYEPASSGRFPANAIRLYWNVTSGETYGVQALGESIPILDKLPPPSYKLLSSDKWPRDRQLIALPLKAAAVELQPAA